ncbi:MAG TPA: SAM-dependent methyltransferase [Peptococcaceae bacterium]|nr:MAG: tRNA methyltransferase complex GCD14 subunit [Clostridia bacterium 41_269]HBT20839.1 SAM-dependent methyltransferase [Peptococcaceae bacterium]
MLDDKILITDGKKFKRVFNINSVEKVKLPTGEIDGEKLKEIQKGSSFIVNNRRYYVFNCDLYDYIMYHLTRHTQIVYPKEAAYIMVRLDISPGKRIGEAGTGSGALTAFFSRAVGKDGRVYTYEKREEFVSIAKKNLSRCREFDNIIFHHKSIEDGIEERDLDAFFLDVREPWLVITQVREALKPSGSLGILVPTTNQVSQTIESLEDNNFFILEVSEIIMREFKINAQRLRPKDIMVGHTGYLIFGKKVVDI